MFKPVMLILTLMMSGRMMTLLFIHRAGGALPGDPPSAWLMPLIGDAVIGVSGLVIAYLITRKTGLGTWTAIIVWNAIAIWDALSAYIISTTNPWTEFFMIKLMGPAMFFVASFVHFALLLLTISQQGRMHFLSHLQKESH